MMGSEEAGANGSGVSPRLIDYAIDRQSVEDRQIGQISAHRRLFSHTAGHERTYGTPKSR